MSSDFPRGWGGADTPKHGPVTPSGETQWLSPGRGGGTSGIQGPQETASPRGTDSCPWLGAVWDRESSLFQSPTPVRTYSWLLGWGSQMPHTQNLPWVSGEPPLLDALFRNSNIRACPCLRGFRPTSFLLPVLGLVSSPPLGSSAGPS